MANKTWDAVDHYYSGQGVVLLAERNADGTPKGFHAVGNVPDLKITVATSVLEHKESHTGQRGTDLRLTTETKVALSMTMENFVAENLARVSRGLSTKIAAGQVTAGTIKAYLGAVVALPHINVSDVVITKGATPVDAALYDVNPAAGSVKFKDVVADVTDGETLTVAYKYDAQFQVDALTKGSEDLYMRFEGLNTAEGNSPVVIDVFKFSTDPFKELALIGDGVQSFVLEGSVLADTTRPSGSMYFVVRKVN